MLRRDVHHDWQIVFTSCGKREGKLIYNGRARSASVGVVLLSSLVLDILLRGYHGRAESVVDEAHRMWVYRLSMRKDVNWFLRNCHVCHRVKIWNDTPYELYNLLPVFERNWKSILIDFIIPLPWSNGFNNIWVVIDRLSKMRYMVPCKGDINIVGLANLFINYIASMYRHLNNILSNRGPQFASTFWNKLRDS